MFGIKIQGRLGNQLFQYAFAVAQKKRLHQNFYLHKISRIRFGKHFNVATNNYYFHYTQRFLFTIMNLFKPKVVVQNQSLPTSENLQLFAKDNILIDGFFQSEDFFENVEAEIRQQFSIKEKYKINIQDFTKNNKENIVVHIRRGDFINWGNDELGYSLELPTTYYDNAFAQLDITNKNIIFLSDDIAFTKQNFNVPNAMYSENNTEIFDLQLIINADYLIISNSTFAWWGAYLNQQAKAIYSPKNWLGFKVNKEWPCGVTRKSWMAVSVK